MDLTIDCCNFLLINLYHAITQFILRKILILLENFDLNPNKLFIFSEYFNLLCDSLLDICRRMGKGKGSNLNVTKNYQQSYLGQRKTLLDEKVYLKAKLFGWSYSTKAQLDFYLN